MLNIFQIIFILFSLGIFRIIFTKWKQGALTIRGLIFWLLFWIAADIVVLFPDFTLLLANYVGIGRGTDLVVYMSLAIMFYVIFRLHVKIESMGRDITKVVRDRALKDT